MKLLLVILPIALMIQVSRADEVHKNFDEFQRDVEDLYAVLKSIIPDTEEMVRSTVKALPETEDFSTYKTDLEEYLEDVEKYNTQRGLCMEKTLRVINHINKLQLRYENEDAPEEAKEVVKLLNENGGNEISLHLMTWGVLFRKRDALAHLNDPHTTDAIRMLPMALKAC